MTSEAKGSARRTPEDLRADGYTRGTSDAEDADGTPVAKSSAECIICHENREVCCDTCFETGADGHVWHLNPHCSDCHAEEEEVDDGVHAAHCCLRHGCKYGDDGCPVAKGLVEQDHACESCRSVDDVLAEIRALHDELEWALKRERASD